MRQPSDFEQALDRAIEVANTLLWRYKVIMFWLNTLHRWSTFEMLLHYDEEDELAE